MKQPQLRTGVTLATIVTLVAAFSLIGWSVAARRDVQDLERVAQELALAELHAHTTLRNTAEIFPTHR